MLNKVVDLPDQVGQATNIIQYLLFSVSLIFLRLTSRKSSLSRLSIVWSCLNILITIFSQSTIGNRLIRISIISFDHGLLKAIFQSCGRNFSSILRFARILILANNLVYSSGEILSIYIKSPLSLNLMEIKSLLGSICISDTVRLIARSISALV